MSFSIAGKTALVTGANRGIGEAIVGALVAGGAAKVYAAARNIQDLQPLVAKYGATIVPLTLDITNGGQVTAAATKASDVQLLINNAGVAGHLGGAFEDPQWIPAGRQEIEVNFFGTFAVMQAFAPVLARNGGGAIANLGSIASLSGFPLLLAYSASKAAVHSLTQSARVLLKAQGTQVFGIYPGPIDTRMAEGIDFAKTSADDCAKAILEGIEAGTEDIFPDGMSAAMGAAFLASPKELEGQIAAMGAAAV
jgi:NAD(P)-dependent dehydrogenase (short-subunit alcohol dehydrogenase family)